MIMKTVSALALAASAFGGVNSFTFDVVKPNVRVVTRPSITLSTPTTLKLWRDYGVEEDGGIVAANPKPYVYSGELFGGGKTTMDNCMTITNARTCTEATGEDTCSVEEMMFLIEELERKNNECTEECHQTSTQCGIEVKETRDSLILNLSNQIMNRQQLEQQQEQLPKKVVTMKKTKMATRTSEEVRMELDDSASLMEDVKTCLATQGVSYTLSEMSSILDELELINSDCTEECHQTDEVCDVFLREEREALTEKLAVLIAKIRSPQPKVKTTIQSIQDCASSSTTTKQPSESCYSSKTTLKDMRIMLKDLELLNNECTEEGNQTDPQCDVHVKEERDMFIEYLKVGIKLMEEKEYASAAGLVSGGGFGGPPTTSTSTRGVGSGKNVEYFI